MRLPYQRYIFYVLIMASNNSRIAKNTIYLYLRMFLTMAVSLYTVRVVIQTLSVTDYGLYGAVGGVILAFSFITGVLTNASQRFFAVELGKGAEGRVKEIFSTLFITYVGVSIIIVILAETVGLWFLLNKMTIPPGRESAAMWVYQFALLSFIVTLLTNPYQALIIAHERMNLYAYLSILDVVLKLLIVYMLLMFNYDKLKVYAVLIFLAQFITNSIYVIYCKLKLEGTSIIWKIDKKLFRNVFSYSSWTLFGTVAGMANTQGMNLLLNVFYGPIANAAYSVASQVYHTVGMFANNFYAAVKPPLIKNYAGGDFNYVEKLFQFSSKALFLLIFIVVLPLMVCTEQILGIWLGEVSDYMVVFVRLSLIYTTILTISYPITAVVQAGGFVKLYHSLVDGFSILALPIVYVLFKMGFDAKWAYIVSIVIFSIAHILRLVVLKKVFPSFELKKYTTRFLIPAVILFIVSYVFFKYIAIFLDNSILDVLMLCAISCLTVVVLGVFILLSSAERQMIINIIRNKKKE